MPFEKYSIYSLAWKCHTSAILL